MIDKSERKGRDIYFLNVQELSRNMANNNGLRGEYLTDYAYKTTEEQLKLSKLCRFIKLDDNIYHMYTLDQTDNKVENKIISRFYRLQIMKVTKKIYM